METITTHRYAGTNTDRQALGQPGHCEDCSDVGHEDAHENLGCADVGCDEAHGTVVP